MKSLVTKRQKKISHTQGGKDCAQAFNLRDSERIVSILDSAVEALGKIGDLANIKSFSSVTVHRV